ncbi:MULTISPECIES: DMT family transporter [Nonomuraea]|uniref:DMT family transporter n=1 Tax=Nonomuraea mangrovi TaxID=2316207 RepID=A0ABW4TCI8_9ACTN
MAWIYLLVAAVFEVVFALGTNATEGFTVLGPSLLTIAAAAGGIFFLSLALRTLDVGVGYTVWTGIGSVGTVVLGTLIFEEAMTPGKALAFVLIIGGVLGLKLADRLSPTTPTV